jgi:hypothetical protein
MDLECECRDSNISESTVIQIDLHPANVEIQMYLNIVIQIHLNPS